MLQKKSLEKWQFSRYVNTRKYDQMTKTLTAVFIHNEKNHIQRVEIEEWERYDSKAKCIYRYIQYCI